MSMLFLVFCLLSQSVDTLWTVDFSTTAGEWVTGPQWQWLDDSVFLDIECGGTDCGGYYYSDEDSLLSPLFIVPENADSLVVVFDHYWWGLGGCHAPSEWAQSTSSLSMYSSASPGVLQELWEVSAFIETDYCMSPSGVDVYYSEVDSGYVFVPVLNVSAGDSLSFVYRGLVEAYVNYMNALAYIEWNLYSFTILNYPSVNLERSTWGAIKATF